MHNVHAFGDRTHVLDWALITLVKNYFLKLTIENGWIPSECYLNDQTTETSGLYNVVRDKKHSIDLPAEFPAWFPFNLRPVFPQHPLPPQPIPRPHPSHQVAFHDIKLDGFGLQTISLTNWRAFNQRKYHQLEIASSG